MIADEWGVGRYCGLKVREMEIRKVQRHESSQRVRSLLAIRIFLIKLFIRAVLKRGSILSPLSKFAQWNWIWNCVDAADASRLLGARLRFGAHWRVFITEFLSMRFNLRREGFTPVELLAVVAAVGFLLDLLLSTAQGGARRLDAFRVSISIVPT